jgi:hypothetical protein
VEKLLRTTDARLTQISGAMVKPFMAVPCCEGWAKCPNQGWPNVSACFIDETKKYGANTWHFRLGPWTALPGVDDENEWDDVGGPYLPDSLEWNPAYWSKVRELAWRAHKLGGWVEAVLIDSWYLKMCRGNPAMCGWPPEDAQAAGRTMTPVQEKLIRKGVEELGCWGFVYWTTGNEEDLVPGMSVSWLNRYIEIVRDAEQKVGCGLAHVIGSGSFQPGVNSDFQITHSTSPVTGPCEGKWCENNEHNPAWSPEQEASYFKQALEAGQSWAAWRADASDADWEKRLRLFSDVFKGQGGSVGCFAPDPEDPLWQNPPLTPAQRAPQMLAALNEAKAKVGDRCGATAVCDHEPTPEHPCAPPVHLGCLETNGLVAEELRKMGYCASGPWVDATAILALDGYWEEMHVCSTGNGCYTSNPYLKAWKYKGTNPTPPDPTPPAERVCQGDVCTVSEILCKLHQPGQGLWDCTPKCPNGQPVRPEGAPDRAACEQEAMGGGWPSFSLSSAQGITMEAVENPMQFRIFGSGSGVVMCGTISSGGANVCKAGNTTIQEGVPVSR